MNKDSGKTRETSLNDLGVKIDERYSLINSSIGDVFESTAIISIPPEKEELLNLARSFFRDRIDGGWLHTINCRLITNKTNTWVVFKILKKNQYWVLFELEIHDFSNDGPLLLEGTVEVNIVG